MKTQLFISILALMLAAPTFLNAQNDKAASVAQTYFSLLDAGEFDKMMPLFGAGFMASAPFAPQPVPLDVWKGIGMGFKAGFPDMQHQIVDWVSDGQKVAVRGIFRGTNTGPMQGNPPTGNRVETPFTTVFELDNTLKIKSIHVQFDQLGFQQQLMAGIDPNAKTEATIRAYFAALDAGDAGRIASFCTPGVIQYFPGEPAPLGLSDIQKRAAGFKMGFPDVRREIKQIVVADGWVTVRGLLSGTNSGVFMGRPATGKSISIPVLGLFRLNAEGLIEEAYVEFDTKLVEKQLSDSTTAGNK